jgi:hypothetical protein
MAQSASIDWKSLRAMGSAEKIPEALSRLCHAENPEEATEAYWQIDNTVVVQGQLFEAAVPTCARLVEMLPTCSPAGRPRVIELLAQISRGEADQSEVEKDRSSLQRECMAIIVNGFDLYTSILAHGSDVERLYWLDLLGACAEFDPKYRDRALREISRAASDFSHPEVAKLATEWLRHLKES